MKPLTKNLVVFSFGIALSTLSFVSYYFFISPTISASLARTSSEVVSKSTAERLTASFLTGTVSLNKGAFFPRQFLLDLFTANPTKSGLFVYLGMEQSSTTSPITTFPLIVRPAIGDSAIFYRCKQNQFLPFACVLYLYTRPG